MRMTCEKCGYVHADDEVVAIGRFRADGVVGYTSTVHPEHLLRSTREEAELDSCQWRASVAIEVAALAAKGTRIDAALALPAQGEGGNG